MPFVKVERVKTPARIALSGPTNAGKSYTAIIIAKGLVKAYYKSIGIENPTQSQIDEKIAFIDTERGRGRFYANRDDLPTPTGQFYYMELRPPYNYQKYISAFEQAENLLGEGGVIIIDSLSHGWNGKGGLLERKEEIMKKSKRDSFTVWAELTKDQNEMIDIILGSQLNVICTMRSKMDRVMEKDETTGKNTIKTMGLKPVQRDDLEYEFDITLQLTAEHEATVIKDTTFFKSTSDNDNLGVITPQFGISLFKWLNQGKEIKELLEETRLVNIEEIKRRAKQNPELAQYYKGLFPNKKSDTLNLTETKQVLRHFDDYEKL